MLNMSGDEEGPLNCLKLFPFFSLLVCIGCRFSPWEHVTYDGYPDCILDNQDIICDWTTPDFPAQRHSIVSGGDEDDEDDQIALQEKMELDET